MDIKDILLNHSKKSIKLEELADLIHIKYFDSATLYKEIEHLKALSYIEPVKNSGTNGNFKYPMHKKYRIIARIEVDENIIQSIRILHPVLLKSGYLMEHPLDYTEFHEVIEGLNKYLFTEQCGDFISRKERSYEIFGHEKILDENNVKGLLNKLQITNQILRFYDTPEYCFHDYIPVKKDNMTLLVCENKDIWFNIRRCMFERGWKSIFGVNIDGVVYGEGNRVSQKDGALTSYVRFMGDTQVTILYWGDIDREGFDIYKRTAEVNDSLDISLFVPGYRKMIENAKNRILEDSPSSKKDGISFDELFKEFTEEEKTFLTEALRDNKLIPQEIIPYSILVP